MVEVSEPVETLCTLERLLLTHPETPESLITVKGSGIDANNTVLQNVIGTPCGFTLSIYNLVKLLDVRLT